MFGNPIGVLIIAVHELKSDGRRAKGPKVFSKRRKRYSQKIFDYYVLHLKQQGQRVVLRRMREQGSQNSFSIGGNQWIFCTQTNDIQN